MDTSGKDDSNYLSSYWFYFDLKQWSLRNVYAFTRYRSHHMEEMIKDEESDDIIILRILDASPG
jgi:hypothetical protein